MAVNSSWKPNFFLPRRRSRRSVVALSPLPALVLGLSLSATALAAGEDAGAGPAAEGEHDIGVLTLRPAAYLPAVLMPNARVPDAAPSTADSVVEQWFAGRRGPEGDEASLEVLTLGPDRLQHAGRAYLVLTRPEAVHPQSTVEFPADGRGLATVRLKVSAGQSYLVDFSVSGLGPGAYEVVADSQSRTFEDEVGISRHLLVGLVAEAAGWSSIRLTRPAGGFHLHAVTITTRGEPAPEPE